MGAILGCDKAKMKTIFITGGEGFIGYHLCYTLYRDFSIVTYDNQSHCLPIGVGDWAVYHKWRINELDCMDITRIWGDLNNHSLLRESLRKHKPDIIIHLAALPSSSKCDLYPERAKRDLLDNTLSLLNAVISSGGIEQFIYTSSSMVYGHWPVSVTQPSVVDECFRCEPVGVYGAMKLASEYLVKSYCHRFGMPYTIVRPSAVYGFTMCNGAVTELFVRLAMNGKPLSLYNGGYSYADFTYVKDLVAGFGLLTDNASAIDETFNVTTGNARSVKELAEAVTDILPTEILHVSKETHEPERGTLCIDKAKDILGFKPAYSLETGIEEYIKFYESFVHGQKQESYRSS